MQHSIVALVLAASLANPVWADQRQAGFRVGATVPVRVTLEVVEQPTQLMLTEDDIARGYKDVSARYRVSCNDRGGYVLRIAPRSGIAQYVEIYGLGANVVLRDTAIEIAQPRAAFVQNFALEFHLVLNPSTVPGTVALPVQLAAAPI